MQYDKTTPLALAALSAARYSGAEKVAADGGYLYQQRCFDSVQFRGVQLMSQEEMLPDSQRGFAPVIRGMAHSNAKVTVSQHGYVIYETFVAPGAFAINDLYPAPHRASGDLEVTVTESDGSERHFYPTVFRRAFMLRQGRIKYSASIGRYYSNNRTDPPAAVYAVDA